MVDNAEENKTNGPVFNIQRIYVKDLSFETPNSPAIFKTEWKPDVNVDLNTKTDKVEDDIFEVVLHLTVTVKLNDKTAFLVEAYQAGIFTVKGFPEDQHNHVLGSLCPGILYPYARETISDIVTRGGFPQLLLAPVNFDALYFQHLEQKKNKSDDSKSKQ